MAFIKQAAFTKKVTDLPDTPSPSYTATDIKNHIHTPSSELMTTVNKLVDDLNSSVAGSSGAKNTGASSIAGLTGNDIQSLLESLKTKVDEKTDNAGDHLGTWHGYTPTQVDQTLTGRVNDLDAQLADIATVDVKSFGAVGDGVTDDTVAIQSAFDYNTGGRLRYVKIPDGDYKVNPYTKLKLKSNTKLEFSQNARLLAINTNQDISSMLDVVNVNNIEIINPVIVGDRDTNTMTTEGAGHGISCRTVTNLIIRGGNISKCFTDGIYLHTVTNALIEYVTCDNNRRQGMSITSNIRNLTVRNSSFKNSNGTAPMMGIDIEPNGINDYLENIRLENIYTEGNMAAGIGVNLNQMDNVNTVVDVVIDQWTDNGSLNGFSCMKYAGTISETGSICVRNMKSLNSKKSSVQIIGYKAEGNPKVVIDSPYIYNCNADLGTNERYENNAIAIHAETTGYPVGVPQGNVVINEPYIHMSGRSLLRGFYIGYGAPYKNILIKNPTKIDIGTTALSQNSNTNLIGFNNTNNGNTRIADYNGALQLSSNYSLVRNYTGAYYSKYLIDTLANAVTLQDWQRWDCVQDPFLVAHTGEGTNTLSVKLPTGYKFLDDGNIDQVGKTYSTTSLGAVLKFERLTDTTYKITKLVGSWTVA